MIKPNSQKEVDHHIKLKVDLADVENYDEHTKSRSH